MTSYAHAAGRSSRRRRWSTLLRVAFLVLILLLVTGGIGISQVRDPLSEGRRLYAANCVGCHGEGGNRLPVAPLAFRDFLSAQGDPYLLSVIDQGKSTMPPFGREHGGTLTTDEIESIVRYLRAPQGLLSDAAAPGRSLFYRKCASCHGLAGDRIASAPLNSSDYLSQRSDGALVTSIRDGTGRMPPFGLEKGGSLRSDEIQMLVQYLRNNAEIAGYKAGTPAEARGRDLYVDNCSACHGLDGRRLPQAKIGSEAYVNSRGEGNLVRIIRTGQGSMPAFASTLSAEDAKAIVTYLRTLRLPSEAVAIPAGPKRIGPPPIPHPVDDRRDACVVCHGPQGLRPFPSDHAGRSSASCLACHAPVGVQAARGIPRLPHKAGGREECLTCHSSQGMRPVPSDHAGRGNDLCLSCHRPSEPAPAGHIPRVPHEVQGREDCLGCHKDGFLAPIPADHQGRPLDQCPTCHKPGSTGGTKAPPPIRHEVERAGDCLRCHGPKK